MFCLNLKKEKKVKKFVVFVWCKRDRDAGLFEKIIAVK